VSSAERRVQWISRTSCVGLATLQRSCSFYPVALSMLLVDYARMSGSSCHSHVWTLQLQRSGPRQEVQVVQLRPLENAAFLRPLAQRNRLQACGVCCKATGEGVKRHTRMLLTQSPSNRCCIHYADASTRAVHPIVTQHTPQCLRTRHLVRAPASPNRRILCSLYLRLPVRVHTTRDGPSRL
jgi:hypothetical protein